MEVRGAHDAASRHTTDARSGADVHPQDVPLDTDLGLLFERFRQGDGAATQKLHALIYSELHELARRYMRGQPPGHTLQPTALVNEAYLKLSRQPPEDWRDRSHFVAVAACAMRSVLIDHARARGRREVGFEDASAIDQILVAYEDRALDLLALDSALDRLAQFDPMMARAVELRFFGGLSVDEVAEVMRISKRTLEREWKVTRAWLFQAIS